MEKTFKIVLADDDLDDQEMIKRAFIESRVPYEVNVVYNGLQLMDYLLRREAYRNITDATPNLILLDLNMPLMDGFEVLKEIRRHPDLVDIPIYVITTSRRAEDRRQALALGATGFYSKGASYKDLRRIIQEVCMEYFS